MSFLFAFASSSLDNLTTHTIFINSINENNRDRLRTSINVLGDAYGAGNYLFFFDTHTF